MSFRSGICLFVRSFLDTFVEMHVLTLTTSAARLTQSRKRNGSSFARSFWKPIRRYAFHTWARFFVFRGTTSRILKKPKSASRVVVASSTAVNSASNASSQCDLSELSNGLLPETLTLGELLGKGTFGDVFRATDSQTNETYAVKVVSKTRQGKDPASKKLVKERIEHEVSMWCELQGFPSAVRLLKFYEVNLLLERLRILSRILNTLTSSKSFVKVERSKIS